MLITVWAVLTPNISWYQATISFIQLLNFFRCVSISRIDSVTLSVTDDKDGKANLKSWNFETLELWNFETFELWNLETLELWNFGTLILWNFDTLELWYFGSFILWNFDTLELWRWVVCPLGNMLLLQYHHSSPDNLGSKLLCLHIKYFIYSCDARS